MKLYIILASIILLSCSYSKSKPVNCSNFTIGKFKLRLNRFNMVWIIDRDSIFQYETDSANGNVSKWRVKWIKPCEYELWYIPTKEDKIKKNPLTLTTPFNVAILNGNEQYYIFRETMKGTKLSLIDTMIKIAN
jgi:hypothetical protein